MNNNLEIAIPTSNRPLICRIRTLQLFRELKQYIVLYVESEEQKQLYLNEDPTYAQYRFVITKTQGIGAKRNFIKQHTPKKWLLQVDDDIEQIQKLNDWSNFVQPLKPEELEDFITSCFMTCIGNNAKLWGINGYTNYYYFKRTISTNLKFICGNFHGTIMEGNPVLTPINTMEDYYNTMEHFRRDGKVVRFNDYGTQTRFGANPGGLQTLLPGDERLEEEEQNINFLVSNFKKMCWRVQKKRGADLRLNPHFKNPPKPTLHFHNEDCL